MAMDLSVLGQFGLLNLGLPPCSQLLTSIDPNVLSKTNHQLELVMLLGLCGLE